MQNVRINRNKNQLEFVSKFLNKDDRKVRFQSPITPLKDKKSLDSSTMMKNTDGSHHAKLGKYAVNLWKDKSMTDVLIVVQNQEFKTHKAVLACHSPYFSEVLVKPGFSDVHYLTLPNVTARAFGILLEFMYTGKLRVTCQELNEVYRSARRLGMRDALKECVELLHVTSDNYQNMVYLYVTSRKLNLGDPCVRAFKMMQDHFERLVTTEEFLDLEVDQVVELFSSDEIGARSEIMVFLAALKWLNHRYIEREEHIIPVFSCIRFPLMTREEIVACYHPPVLPGIVQIPAIRAILLNATCYICAKSIDQEHLFDDLSAKPRKFLYAGEVMVLWDTTIFDRDQYQIIKRISAATKIQAAVRGYLARKHFKDDLYVANCAATVVQAAFRGYYVRKAFKMRKNMIEGGSPLTKDLLPALSSKILGTIGDSQDIPLYVMGAFDSEKGSEGQNGIFKFDDNKMNWEFVTKCPVPLHDVRMIATSNTLYIIGGYNPLEKTITGVEGSLKDCYQYQFDGGKWTHLPSMNQGRSLHGAAVLNGMILVIGGKDEENRILSSIERYNPSTNKWEEFDHPLPEPRMGMGVASDGSTLWIAGGLTSDGEQVNLLDSVWSYNKENARWNKTVILPDPIALSTLLNNGEELILVGGVIRTNRDDKSQLESVDTVLSLEGDEWTKKAQMPVQCHNAVATIIGEKIFVFGGFQTQTMSQVTEANYLDIGTDDWHPLSDLPKDAAGFMVALSQNQS